MQLIKFLSERPAKVRISPIANDVEAFRFAQDWYEVLQAAGWTIEENRVAAFISGGTPQFGMVVKFHGEAVAPGQSFQVPNTEPVGYIARATEALKITISEQRLPDIQEGEMLLEFHAQPPSN